MRISDWSSDVCSSDLIRRENGKRRVVVQMNLEDRDAGSFVEEARAKIAQIELPAGYYLEWGGQFESLQAATARLSIVVPLAFVAIFRSEERRVGKDCVISCRSRWSPYH